MFSASSCYIISLALVMTCILGDTMTPLIASAGFQCYHIPSFTHWYPNKKHPPVSHIQANCFCWCVFCVYFYFTIFNLFVFSADQCSFPYVSTFNPFFLHLLNFCCTWKSLRLSCWQAHNFSGSCMLSWRRFGVFIPWEACRFCHTIYWFMGWICSTRICICWGNICCWPTGLSLTAFEFSDLELIKHKK